MAYQKLFSKSLSGLGDVLHFAAHSHHLWPDAAIDGQSAAINDALRLADDKWDHFFRTVYPKAQNHVAQELGLSDPSNVVFAPNTHQLIVSLFSAIEAKPIRLLTTDGEFHSLSRQRDRWIESGYITCETVPLEPAETFDARFIAAAKTGAYDVIFLSHVFFGRGHIFNALDELAVIDGPIIVVDGYHGFKAIRVDWGQYEDRLFYLSGGYKYAMSGEGCCFLAAPRCVAERPEITGWYAAFGDLIAPPAGGVGYARDASRFLGATFDPSGIYRFNAVQDMLAEQGLTKEIMSRHVQALLAQLSDKIAAGEAGALKEAAQLNDVSQLPCARFLALQHPNAQDWQKALHKAGVMSDVRGDVLRLGLAIYHSDADVERFCKLAAKVIN